MQKKYKGWRVYVYVAVNWFTGPLYIQLMSGSYPYKSKYTVGLVGSWQ